VEEDEEEIIAVRCERPQKLLLIVNNFSPKSRIVMRIASHAIQMAHTLWIVY
jgi:hypothetical protein